jgi:hypothetical protein
MSSSDESETDERQQKEKATIVSGIQWKPKRPSVKWHRYMTKAQPYYIRKQLKQKKKKYRETESTMDHHSEEDVPEKKEEEQKTTKKKLTEEESKKQFTASDDMRKLNAASPQEIDEAFLTMFNKYASRESKNKSKNLRKVQKKIRKPQDKLLKRLKPPKYH